MSKLFILLLVQYNILTNILKFEIKYIKSLHKIRGQFFLQEIKTYLIFILIRIFLVSFFYIIHYYIVLILFLKIVSCKFKIK